MLLIQNVDLTWSKRERGSECAKARRRFPLAYPLSKSMSAAVAVQTLSFFQHGETFVDSLQDMRQGLEVFLPGLGFTSEQIRQEVVHRTRWIKKHQEQCYRSAADLNLTNLSIQPWQDGFELSFFYDEHRSGMPYRRGHNQDYQKIQSPLYQKDCINEVAFSLQLGQYGRILWNERRTDCDTREWYYQLHIYNIFCLADRVPSVNLFVANEPDFVYQQLAHLY